MANPINCSLNANNYFFKTNTSYSNLRLKPTEEKNINHSQQLAPPLNSPRSQLALKTLGMTKSELHYLTFNQFKESYPNVYMLPRHFQKLRYQFYNTHRIDKIEQVVETKSRLSMTPMRSSISQSQIIKILQKTNSSFISHKLKEYKRVQSKNEIEMMATIQKEIEKEILTNQIKADQLERERNAIINVENEKRKHQMNIAKMSNDSLENAQLQDDKQNTRKHTSKQKGYIDKVNKMEEEYINYLKVKSQEIEDKILLNKIELKKKRIAKSNEKERQMQSKKEEAEKNRVEIEKKSTSFKEAVKEKDKLKEINREIYELKQNTRQIKQQEHLSKKLINIKKTLIHNQQQFNQKVAEYFFKQQLEDERLEYYFNKKKAENEKLKEHCLEKNNQIYTSHLWNEAMLNEKRRQMMIKNNEREENMIKNKEMKQMNMFLIQEQNNKKQYLKEEKLRMMQNIVRYQQEEILNKINNKHLRAHEYASQKMRLNEELRKIPQEIEKNKREKTEKITKAFVSKSFNKKTIGTLRELFPLRDFFDDLIKELYISHSKSSKLDMNNTQSTCKNITYALSNDIQTPLNNEMKSIQSLKEEDKYFDQKPNKSLEQELNSNTNVDISKTAAIASNDTIINKNQLLEIKLKEHKREISKELEDLLNEERIRDKCNRNQLKNKKTNKQSLTLDSQDKFIRNKKIVELNK